MSSGQMCDMRVHWLMTGSTLFQDCVMMPQRLMAMAENIISMPKRSFDIVLGGACLLAHPGLGDIMGFFSRSQKFVRICLQTDLANNLDKLFQLSPRFNPRQISLDLGIAPATVNPESLENLMAFSREKECPLHVRFHPDMEHLAETDVLADLILEARKNVPFSIAMQDTRGTPLREWGNAFAESFAASSIKSNYPQPVASAADWTQRTWPSSAIGKVFYCCQGANYMRVEPDGAYIGAPCGNAPAGQYLWRDFNYESLRRIVRCTNKVCMKRLVQPEFKNLGDALEWFEEGRNKDAGFVRSNKIQGKYSIRSTFGTIQKRLERMEKLEDGISNSLLMPAMPHLFQNNAEDICKIYELLEDTNSKRFFLRCLKALAEGDSSWLEAQEPIAEIQAAFTFEIHADNFLINLRDLMRQKAGCKFYLRPNDKNHDSLAILFAERSAMESARIALEISADKIPTNSRPAVSIIIDVPHDCPNLAQMLCGALLQRVNPLEIIIAHGKINEATSAVIYEYLERYPGLVRECVPVGNPSSSERRNRAMRLALGRNIVFVSGGFVADPDFLNTGLSVMRARNATLCAFGKENKPSVWEYPPHEYQGESALESFLTSGFGDFSCDGKIYDAQLLSRNNIDFTEEGIAGEYTFNMRAFLAAKAVAIPQNAGVRSKECNPGLASLANLVEGTHDFIVAHGLDADSKTFGQFFHSIYSALRHSLTRQICKTEAAGNLADILSPANLYAIGKCRPIMEAIIKDYALLNGEIKNVDPVVAEGALNWRDFTVEPFPDDSYTAYLDAENPHTPEPLLSVIVLNYNREDYLDKCLKSILAQSMSDYEIIIVDDGSKDESRRIFQEYADLYPNIRLFMMVENNMQGVCRNMAIRKARGKYFLFVDSDDTIEPGYFRIAKEIMEKSGADISIYGWRLTGGNGKERYKHDMRQTMLTGKEAFALYLKDGFPGSPWAKVFRTDFVLASGAKFGEHVTPEDQYFIGDLVAKARLVELSPFIAYSVFESEDSTIRPASRKYLHIYSACHVYDFFQRIVGESFNNCYNFSKHAIWDLENITLHPWLAYLNATGEIALRDEDYTLLSKSQPFLFSLLLGFSRAMGQRRQLTEGKKVPAKMYPLAKPLVSIIVPVFNQEGKVGACLDSILAQSMPSFEVIIVNDASTDHSLDVCGEYAKRDSRIRMLSNQRNSGQGISRNRAIAVAHGEFITFVDSDDLVLPDFLLQACAQLIRYPQADIIQFAKATDVELKKVHRPVATVTALSGQEMGKLQCETKISYWEAWGKVYRKKFLQDNRIEFPDTLYEDQTFIHKAYLNARQIIIDPAVAYIYVATPHEAFTVNPLKLKPRHIEGYFKKCANINQLYSSHENEVQNIGMWGARRKRDSWKGKYQKLWPPYIAAQFSKNAMPMTADLLANLGKAPEIFLEILKEYALLYRGSAKTWPRFPISPIESAKPILLPVLEAEGHTLPSLSVIVTARNASKNIEQAIQGIGQHESVEIILIDLFSRDNTLEICARLAPDLPNCRVFRLSEPCNEGFARNMTLDLAKGAQICFMDGNRGPVNGFLDRILSRHSDAEIMHYSTPAYDNTAYCGALKFPALFNAAASGIEGMIFSRTMLNKSGARFGLGAYNHLPFLLTATQNAASVELLELSPFAEQKPVERGISPQQRFRNALLGLREMQTVMDKEFPDKKDRDKVEKAWANWLVSGQSSFRADLLDYINTIDFQNPDADLEVAEEVVFILDIPEVARTILVDYSQLAEKKTKGTV